MSRTFHIVAERAAVRCEVCHQADEFDAVSGMCQRCTGIVIPHTSVNVSVTDYNTARWNSRVLSVSSYIVMIPLFFAFLYSYWKFQPLLPIDPDPDPDFHNDTADIVFLLKVGVCLLPLIELILVARLVYLWRNRLRNIVSS